jgi:hypothetical protein
MPDLSTATRSCQNMGTDLVSSLPESLEAGRPFRVTAGSRAAERARSRTILAPVPAAL